MKIVRILIEMEREGSDKPDHATSFEFEDGMWKMDGLVYPRIMGALQDVWKVLRNEVINK